MVNIVFGYSDEEMFSSYLGDELETSTQYRQIYTSSDIADKIKTRNKFKNSVFSSLNFIKIPTLAIEFTRNGKIKGN